MRSRSGAGQRPQRVEQAQRPHLVEQGHHQQTDGHDEPGHEQRVQRAAAAHGHDRERVRGEARQRQHPGDRAHRDQGGVQEQPAEVGGGPGVHEVPEQGLGRQPDGVERHLPVGAQGGRDDPGQRQQGREGAQRRDQRPRDPPGLEAWAPSTTARRDPRSGEPRLSDRHRPTPCGAGTRSTAAAPRAS